jgi:hypothetical protein
VKVTVFIIFSVEDHFSARFRRCENYSYIYYTCYMAFLYKNKYGGHIANLLLTSHFPYIADRLILQYI